ncbi:MAG TPA: helix-turn-helix transcriptional regulator [Gemmatimonadales bacterium]|nr:helix-turn-helix transcriptional regulator [Gemmatimonadales bacterium]
MASGWTLPIADDEWIPIARGLALTRRESEIVRCVLDNLDSESIAARFAVSPRTVRAHLEHIYRKLGLHNRCDLVLLVFAASLEQREVD